jgi:transcriptional regulator NrdR family protein
MGQWTTSNHSSVVLPKPSDKYQQLVHEADFLASRADINTMQGDKIYVWDDTVVETIKQTQYIVFLTKIGVYIMSDTNKEVKMQVAPTFVCNVMSVKKRSGETVAFDARKIYEAIKKAACATNEISDEYIAQITNEVLNDLDNNFMGRTPSVEEIQEIVIRKLMDSKSYKTAEAYIIYRQKHSEISNANGDAIGIIES